MTYSPGNMPGVSERLMMIITYQQQQQAVREACKQLEKELNRNSYEASLRAELTEQLEALKEVLVSLDKLQQLSKLLKEI